jgi:hypothetical protein
VLGSGHTAHQRQLRVVAFEHFIRQRRERRRAIGIAAALVEERTRQCSNRESESLGLFVQAATRRRRSKSVFVQKSDSVAELPRCSVIH